MRAEVLLFSSPLSLFQGPEAKLVLCNHVMAAGGSPCAGASPSFTSAVQPPGSGAAGGRPGWGQALNFHLGAPGRSRRVVEGTWGWGTFKFTCLVIFEKMI